jgi:hypothetical protein
MPLLDRIAKERGSEDYVCPVIAATRSKLRPGLFREHLTLAKIDAPAFFVETATHEKIDFRSLRDSGITWRFLAEHRESVVQRECGHKTLTQTLTYAKEVQNRQGRYGVPFPTLPDDLVEGPSPTGGTPAPLSTPTSTRSKNTEKKRWRRWESNACREHTRSPGKQAGSCA